MNRKHSPYLIIAAVEGPTTDFRKSLREFKQLPLTGELSEGDQLDPDQDLVLEPSPCVGMYSDISRNFPSRRGEGKHGCKGHVGTREPLIGPLHIKIVKQSGERETSPTIVGHELAGFSHRNEASTPRKLRSLVVRSHGFVQTDENGEIHAPKRMHELILQPARKSSLIVDPAGFDGKLQALRIGVCTHRKRLARELERP